MNEPMVMFVPPGYVAMLLPDCLPYATLETIGASIGERVCAVGSTGRVWQAKPIMHSLLKSNVEVSRG